MSAVDSAGMRAGRLGFGVIELMVAVAIVAILTATALPSFREMGRRMTVTSTTNDLVGALAMARAEAANDATIETGVEMTSAHGQAITSRTSAR